jgi:hypothetical protein
LVVLSFDQQSHDFQPRLPENYHYVDVDKSILTYQEKIYLPLYSRDYLDLKVRDINLLASVYIENKSHFEPIYLMAINHYNSDGDLAGQIINKPVKIYPLESARFILNNQLANGKNGENLIIDWGCTLLDEKPDIYIDMVIVTPEGSFSYKDQGVIVSDQNEINDRRPL